jgi:RNA polymerase sigma-54 factor
MFLIPASCLSRVASPTFPMNNQLQSQGQRLSVLPQQIQLLKLFHLNGCELQSRITEELLDNPLLEESVTDERQELKSEDSEQEYEGPDEFSGDDIPDYAVEHQNYLSETDIPQRPIPEPNDFRKDLKEQLRTQPITGNHLLMAEYLIDSLGDDGLLTQDMSEMADDFSFQKCILVTADQMESARQVLLSLDPAGIGSLNIKEFLISQLKLTNHTHANIAVELLEKNFNVMIVNRDMGELATLLEIDEDELLKVMELVTSCQLKPLAESSNSVHSESITIDFVVTEQDDAIDVKLFHQRSSTLFVNNSLSKMLKGGKAGDKQELQYMKGKLSSAQWFVDAIKQRETTMLKVMNAIVTFQYAYFRDGDACQLKPMILQDISDLTGAHISTISRITCNKYADTPFGPILLKNLFSKGIENERGEAVSNKVIQLALEEAVAGESKLNPYTDQQLMSLLAGKGINIARRTVAKYREQRGIPVVRVRASIARNNSRLGVSEILSANNSSLVLNG